MHETRMHILMVNFLHNNYIVTLRYAKFQRTSLDFILYVILYYTDVMVFFVQNKCTILKYNLYLKCLLLFGAESFVFQFVIQNFKDQDIQNYDFARCLYGCETWSLTLRKERRLRVFENMVLRRLFEPKRDEVTVEWRKLHNEELMDLLLPTQYCAGVKDP